MLAAFDFIQAIPERIQEVFVGIENGTVGREFDHGLCAIDGRDFSRILVRGEFRLGDIGGDFHHPFDLAAFAHDRIVGGLDPDFLSAGSDPLVLPGVEFAATKLGPESLVIRAFHVSRFAEHAVVPALDVVQAVAERLAEVLVGPRDFTGRIELDDRQRFTDGFQSICGVAKSERSEHFPAPMSSVR